MDRTTVAFGVIGAVLSAISIWAIYYGPIHALQKQRQLDDEREARTRKLKLFKTLVSQRIALHSFILNDPEALYHLPLHFSASVNRPRTTKRRSVP